LIFQLRRGARLSIPNGFTAISVVRALIEIAAQTDLEINVEITIITNLEIIRILY
jgi:hypothetical protein